MKHINLVSCLAIFFFSTLSNAQVFNLSKVEIYNSEDNSSVVKTYTAKTAIKVEYSYGLSDYDQSENIYFNFDDDGLMPVDLGRYGITLESDDINAALKNSVITSVKPTESCNYIGTANILFKEVYLDIPELEGEVLSGGTVLKVINATPPKRRCD